MPQVTRYRTLATASALGPMLSHGRPPASLILVGLLLSTGGLASMAPLAEAVATGDRSRGCMGELYPSQYPSQPDYRRWCRGQYVEYHPQDRVVTLCWGIYDTKLHTCEVDPAYCVHLRSMHRDLGVPSVMPECDWAFADARPGLGPGPVVGPPCSVTFIGDAYTGWGAGFGCCPVQTVCVERQAQLTRHVTPTGDEETRSGCGAGWAFPRAMGLAHLVYTRAGRPGGLHACEGEH